MSVAEAPWEMIVSICEPRLSSRGKVVGSTVSIQTVEEALQELQPSEARRLARALSAAADRAEQADRILVPILETYREALDEFQGSAEEPT